MSSAKRRASKESRSTLEKELFAVRREISLLKAEPRAEEWEGAGDNTPLSEEVDAIAASEERESRAERLDRLVARAAALHEALRRVGEGTYGICIACEGPISPTRLRALPEAERCARCQEAEEARSRNPREIHGHEWKLAIEIERERRKGDEEPRSLTIVG